MSCAEALITGGCDCLDKRCCGGAESPATLVVDDVVDEDPRDSKIIRLHLPARRTAGGEGHEPSIEEQVEAVELELKNLMGYARQAEVPRVQERRAEGQRVPTATHRNAVRCPQCDDLTWRHNRYCVSCGGDLMAYAAEQAEQSRQTRQAVGWAVAISSWVIALTCLFVAQHYTLPPPIHRALNAAGGLILGVNAAVLWYSSLDKRG